MEENKRDVKNYISERKFSAKRPEGFSYGVAKNLVDKIKEAVKMGVGYENDIEETEVVLDNEIRPKMVEKAENDLRKKKDDLKEFNEMTAKSIERARVEIEKAKKHFQQILNKSLQATFYQQDEIPAKINRMKQNMLEKGMPDEKITAMEESAKKALDNAKSEMASVQKAYDDKMKELDSMSKLLDKFEIGIEKGFKKVNISDEGLITFEEQERKENDIVRTVVGETGGETSREEPKEGDREEETRESAGEGPVTGETAEGPAVEEIAAGAAAVEAVEGSAREESEGESPRAGAGARPIRGAGEGEKTGSEGEQGEREDVEGVENELTKKEQLRHSEREMLEDFVDITSITYSAKTNTYTFTGIDKEGNESAGVVKALDRRERKNMKNIMPKDVKRKADPNIYRILKGLSDDSSKDIFEEYEKALLGECEMEDVKITYDFNKKTTRELEGGGTLSYANEKSGLGLFAKLRARFDANRNKAVATIINRKGSAKLNGEEIKALVGVKSGVANEARRMDSVIVENYNGKAAIDAYKAKIEEDKAANFVVKDQNGQEK